jgi:hypothetical protein
MTDNLVGSTTTGNGGPSGALTGSAPVSANDAWLGRGAGWAHGALE